MNFCLLILTGFFAALPSSIVIESFSLEKTFRIIKSSPALNRAHKCYIYAFHYLQGQ